MGVLDRVVQKACGDETCRVGHVDEQESAYLVGDLTHAFVVPFAAVGRSAADDQFGFVLHGERFHRVVVDRAGLLSHLVAYGLVEDAGHVDGRTVRKVAAVCQVESHEGIAGFEYRHEDGHVGLCAGVGLYVGILGTVEFADAVDGELFHLVHYLAAAVVACTGVALGVFVGEHGAHGLHHFVADEVFRRDQFDAVELTLFFLFDEVEDLIIPVHEILSYVENELSLKRSDLRKVKLFSIESLPKAKNSGE